MSIITAPLRLRLALDPASFTAIHCRLQLGVPKFWRGQPLDIEVGLYQYGTWVDDLSNYVAINMEIHPATNRAGTLLISKEILVASMSTPTEAQWLANTHQHATFELSSADTNFDLSGAVNNQLGFWMVFWAELTDGNTPPIGYTEPTVIESAAALSLGALGSSNPNYVVTTRQLLCVKGQTAGGVYPIIVDDSGAVPVLTVGDAL
ncbi:MAG: hypothetical protein V1929_00340 [bacterium]